MSIFFFNVFSRFCPKHLVVFYILHFVLPFHTLLRFKLVTLATGKKKNQGSILTDFLYFFPWQKWWDFIESVTDNGYISLCSCLMWGLPSVGLNSREFSSDVMRSQAQNWESSAVFAQQLSDLLVVCVGVQRFVVLLILHLVFRAVSSALPPRGLRGAGLRRALLPPFCAPVLEPNLRAITISRTRRCW